MQHGAGAQYLHRSTDTTNDGGWVAGGNRDGSHTNGEHHAFWHVQQPDQSDRDRGNSSQVGRGNASALYSCNTGAMASRRTNRFDWGSTGSWSLMPFSLYLGWVHSVR